MSEEVLLCNEIRKFVKESEFNVFAETGKSYFEEPLIQFASAKNPLFEQYKDLIGTYHLTPQEALMRLNPEQNSEQNPEQKESEGSVISIVLPVSREARESNRRETEFGSREWSLTRYFGDEVFVERLVEHVCMHLQKKGYTAVAPGRSDFFQKMRVGQDISSNWSERHIAFAAGLGTFSINDGFITEKGIAVKLVSIVTDAHFEQSAQEYQHYRQNCLWSENKTCGACMKRCPVGAITEKGHDKLKCFLHCYGERSGETAVQYGGSREYGSGCGLCQTGVPCEYRNPR